MARESTNVEERGDQPFVPPTARTPQPKYPLLLTEQIGSPSLLGQQLGNRVLGSLGYLDCAVLGEPWPKPRSGKLPVFFDCYGV
ncbi:hypothetical protein FJTKL_13912 [Diaporthe vaccinii]|uniref:Uncharacterized protein n=1 Tax=Diaporthe vaccinii TaxID=105482 RepID=A0ABR4F9C1_9PEZI